MRTRLVLVGIAVLAIAASILGAVLHQVSSGLSHYSGPAVYAEGVGGVPAPAGQHIGIALESVSPHPGQWLFHFRVHNTTGAPYTLLGTGQDHQFVFYGMPDTARPGLGDQLTLLVAPHGANASGHPALIRNVGAAGTADGWLEADFSSAATYPAYEVQYRYAPVSVMQCPGFSTTNCQPLTVYNVVVWAPLTVSGG